jgi:hypothetical protein
MLESIFFLKNTLKKHASIELFIALFLSLICCLIKYFSENRQLYLFGYFANGWFYLVTGYSWVVFILKKKFKAKFLFCTIIGLFTFFCFYFCANFLLSEHEILANQPPFKIMVLEDIVSSGGQSVIGVFEEKSIGQKFLWKSKMDFFQNANFSIENQSGKIYLNYEVSGQNGQKFKQHILIKTN